MSNVMQDYDLFDYLFGWLFDYDEDLDFDNKNVTSKKTFQGKN